MTDKRRFWLVAFGLSIVLVPVCAEIYFGILYDSLIYNSAILWIIGTATGVGLSIFLSWLFGKLGRKAILPVLNGAFTIIVIGQAYFWSVAYFPSDSSPFFGIASTVFLTAVLFASFRESLAVPVWVLCHEAINVAALVVVNFSWLYWNQSAENESCMQVILTRTDSVYFTLTTLATVGYGDIHPVSEACRKLVSAQIITSSVFVVIVLGLLVSRIAQGIGPPSDKPEFIIDISGMRKDIDGLSEKLEELKVSLDILQDQRPGTLLKWSRLNRKSRSGR